MIDFGCDHKTIDHANSPCSFGITHNLQGVKDPTDSFNKGERYYNKDRARNNFNISSRSNSKKFTPAFDQIETFSVKSAFDGALYPKGKSTSLVKYLEKRGVNVYGTEGNPKFVGMWDGTGQIYLPKDPTVLQVKHELSHYLDFKNLGVHEYVKLSRYEREALVLERLENNRIWSGFNELEKEFSRNYVKELQPKSIAEVRPNE